MSLKGREFSALMKGLGPFEPEPCVAVAVSGGCDSMALALLAHDWAQGRGGQTVALSVDHRLRWESGAEARQAGRWLKARGLTHHILSWTGDKPRHGVQAAAREARYRLLFDWCRRHGVLHLLLAHHQEDQAETFLLRLGRGSGVDGLAGMAPLSEVPTMRLLRPLLDVPKARLVATLQSRGQEWVEDPSNRDLAYARVR
ncbi:MAG: tRNA lysidine(34) synthetase TilS, partial [Rhodospirillaceae bacterium]|nr:tRNA lysidine(34) synthetase TilS [Rhodospirillaceae bacterium]